MKTDMLQYAAARYGTPLYVFDLDILKEQTGRIREKLGTETGLCYAMKANPFLTEQMAELTDRIEVCSRGEFEICRHLGIPPEKLLISGLLKKKEDIEAILEYCGGRCAYTVESVRQFHYLAEWSDARAVSLRLYLRLTGGDQFGMDEATLRNVIGLINMSPYLEIEGLHYFTGTQKKSLKQLGKELEYLDDFLIRMKKEAGCEVSCLEYGPGIAVPYFPGKDPETFSDEGLESLGNMIAGMRWKGRVTVEMGRAFAAMCGYYLTQICDVKTNGSRNYCIVDGGNHQINYYGQIRGMYEPYMEIIPEVSDRERKWTVCGCLCSVNDILCRDVQIPGIRTGRVLVFERAGAYSVMEGAALFLSHSLPAVTSWSRTDGWRLLRKRTDTYPFNMADNLIQTAK